MGHFSWDSEALSISYDFLQFLQLSSYPSFCDCVMMLVTVFRSSLAFRFYPGRCVGIERWRWHGAMIRRWKCGIWRRGQVEVQWLGPRKIGPTWSNHGKWSWNIYIYMYICLRKQYHYLRSGWNSVYIYDNVYLRNCTINELPLSSEHQPAEHGGAMFPVDEP